MAESPYIIDVTRENYAQVMKASFEVPVLIDFWASWCQPCQALMPVLAKLADEYQGKFVLGKLNTEEQQEIAAQFGIRSIPNVKLFRNGQPVDEFMGALPERAVREFLDRHIARESDVTVQEAREKLAAGDADAAIALLNQARAADPDNPRVVLALAGAQAAADGGEPARAVEPPEKKQRGAAKQREDGRAEHGRDQKHAQQQVGGGHAARLDDKNRHQQHGRGGARGGPLPPWATRVPDEPRSHKGKADRDRELKQARGNG